MRGRVGTGQADFSRRSRRDGWRATIVGFTFSRTVCSVITTLATSVRLGMSYITACELAPQGVRVNCLAPGYIAVPMSPSMRAVSGGEEALIPTVPLRRLGTVDEMAEIVEFLLSDRASYITGTTIVADGGVTAL